MTTPYLVENIYKVCKCLWILTLFQYKKEKLAPIMKKRHLALDFYQDMGYNLIRHG